MSGWLIEGLIASALLMAAVLALREPVRAAFGPGVAYALWALPALRLVLPPLPIAWSIAAPLPAATPISAAGQAVVIVFEGAPTVATSTARWPAMVAALWAAGAIAFLAYQALRYRAFCRDIARETLAAERLGSIRVVTSTAASGPLAFGLLHRTVALPADFAERYDADERALALAHEIGHHRRGDLFANWGALAVLACHWPNPLAWIAFRAFRADQELANDAQVLAGRPAGARHAYARAIVKAAGVGSVAATCHLHTIENLKGRLHMLKWSPASSRRIASGAVSVAAIAVAGLVLTASGSGAAAIAATAQAAVPEMARMPAMSEMQTMPSVPATPPPPLPPSRHGDLVASAPAKHVRKVVVVKDGKAERYEGAAADAYLAANPPPATPVTSLGPVHIQADRIDVARNMPASGVYGGKIGEPIVIRLRSDGQSPAISPENMPTVITTDCPPGDPKQTVYRDRKDGKQRVFICQNRIAAMTATAQASALAGRNIAANARANANASLATARAAIVADRNLSDGQRREALAGVDRARAELAVSND